MKTRSKIVVAVAIALLGLACSNSKKKAGGPDAGKDSGAVGGSVYGSGRDAGDAAGGRLETGADLAGEDGGRFDGRVATETGGDGPFQISPDTADPSILSDAARDAAPPDQSDAARDAASADQADAAQMPDSAGDGGAGDADAGETGLDPASLCMNGCPMGGHCYQAGAANAGNPCLICDPRRSTSAWSPNDGVACDDGAFCTVGDKCSAGKCQGRVRDCSDGVVCNGVETCDELGDVCLAGTSTCAVGSTCDHQSGKCVATCAGCMIGDTCYGEGQPNPSNPCQKCSKISDASAWSHNDGVACDDGLFCTVHDRCSAGACTGSARDCTDSIECNGAETCDETADVCRPGTGTCGDKAYCNWSTYQCEPACTGCPINGVCYREGQINPLNPCQICARATSSTAWSNHDDFACDDGKFCSVDDTCVAGECKGTLRPCDDGIACNGSEVCDETNKACTVGTTTCGVNEVCDTKDNLCICTGCLIKGVCYGDGQINAGNACQKCDKTAKANDWSNDDGASCDDGLFCTVGDVCSKGACTGSSPCKDGTSCIESKKACYLVGVPMCNADGDAFQYDLNGDPLPLHDCVAAADHGTCTAGECGCMGGYNGDDCRTRLIHVRMGGSDDNDGSTWALAKGDVQQGLSLAATMISAGAPACEIWVAAGTYKPTAGTDRTATFQLLAKVGLYGGFAGTESRRDQRDIATNVTTLSGDIGNSVYSTDNSYHVVTGVDNATIDGFTITGGNASGTPPNNAGGGMYNSVASPTVSNCAFSGNSASSGSSISSASSSAAYGGGVYNDSSSPIISNCTFSGNSASSESSISAASGGGVYNNNSSPTISNCTFFGNSATANASASASASGGGVYNDNSSSPRISNCTFSHNAAYSMSFSSYSRSSSLGGGVCNNNSTPTISNCTFSRNLASSSMSGSTIPGTPASCGGGVYNVISSPTFSNCTFSDNAAVSDLSISSSSYGGGVCNDFSSPVFTNCIFSGNYASAFNTSASFGGAVLNESESSPTFTNCTFSGNSATQGGGMVNSVNSRSTITNSIFWDRGISEFFGGGELVTYSIVQGGHVGEGNSDSSPLFVSSTEQPLRLDPNSPAIDHGTGCATSVPVTDKDGNPRWDITLVTNASGTSGVDIGAYEFQGTAGQDTLVAPLCASP